jgi:hypothetical protein
VPDQVVSAQDNNSDLQAALRSLLEVDLSEQQLREELRALAETPEGATAPPTTDDATEHPGYQ